MKLDTMNIETEKYLAGQIECGEDYAKLFAKQTLFFNRLRDSAHENGDSFAAQTGTNIARLEMTITELTSKLVAVNRLINPVQDKTQEHIKF